MAGNPYLVALMVAIAVLMAGCVNMATPPERIAAIPSFSLKYEVLDCSRLIAEANYLARREAQLVAAQEDRVKNSNMQAYWFRIGQGDGVVAEDLAVARGEKDAAQHALKAKRC